MEKKVLIVEDDLAQRPFWEFVLHRKFANVAIDWVVSASEAKEAFRRDSDQPNDYAAIIVDLFLSGSETGLDLLRHFKTLNQDLPIILVSAVEADRLRDEIEKEHSEVIVLQKPLNLQGCRTALDAATHSTEIQ